MRARVREDYAVQYPDPINVGAGASVTVGRRDDRFSRWLWCCAEDGREGWVPETILSSTEPGPAIVSEPYKATELPARAGALVEVIEQFDGFVRVRSIEERLGWLPAAVLDILDGEAGAADQRNIETLMGIFEAFNRNDVDRAAEGLDPDVVYTIHGRAPVSGTYRGREAMAGALHRIKELTSGTMTGTPEVVMAKHDRVMMYLHVTGSRPDGRKVQATTRPTSIAFGTGR